MIAAGATITVAYPHMNSIGGDSFWLIHTPRRAPQGIDACGAAARAASIAWYAARGVTSTIPHRGAMAANTVAGAVSGWGAAFTLSRKWGGRLPVKRLLADAIHYAEHGIPVSASQSALGGRRGNLCIAAGEEPEFGPFVPAAYRRPAVY